MDEEEARRLYYQSRVHLVNLVAKRDRLLRSLQRGASELDGAFLSTEDGESLREIDALTAEIVKTTKLVNQYADMLGSPRAGGDRQDTSVD